MKLYLISDQHVFHRDFDDDLVNVPQEAEVMVVAGDLTTQPDVAEAYFRVVRGRTEIPVVYVLGNHEYWAHRFPDVVEEYRRRLKDIPDVHLLEKQSVELGGYTFHGTTLWSDLSDPMAAQTVQRRFNDFLAIRTGKRQRMTPALWNEAYLTCRNWLSAQLEKEGKHVVVTHHAPSWECRAKDFDYEKDSRYASAHFCSELSTLIHKTQPCAWLYGHTHRGLTLKIGDVPVFTNPVGYAAEYTKAKFNPDRVWEI